MTNKSSRKGKGYERETAKFLTELYGETFIKVPGSGAYVGGQNKVRKILLDDGMIRIFKGDVVPGLSFPKLVIECKNYDDFPFHHLLDPTREVRFLEEWLDQLLDCADEDDFLLLIMKFSRKGQYIAIQEKHLLPGSRFSLQQTKGTKYYSPNYGTWLITEFNYFWHTNKDAVKVLSNVANPSVLT